jgi:MOSC domain-containing protein YiiM
MGKVLRIFLRSERKEPVIEVDYATAVVGTGLNGDHFNKKGKRQITILSKKAWEEACQKLGKEIDPKFRRANLLVDGIYFQNYSINRILRIGKVRIRITGETKPCRLMDDVEEGLKDALEYCWRGGAFGEVIKGGPINVGDAIEYGDNWCKWGFHDWIELNDFNQSGAYCQKCDEYWSFIPAPLRSLARIFSQSKCRR